MKKLLLISKNPVLVELMPDHEYEVSWCNDCQNVNKEEVVADVIVYDSFSYGLTTLKNDFFTDKALVILDGYKESAFVSSITNCSKRAYLLVEDFIEELPHALSAVLSGETFVTEKLSCPLP
ncbi:hypothetical protein E1176_15885 [Fulvivirga sp. RKSG066]|uniref:hypothetical protein n=1 Tax=Fulvivirga aurantia TaxID=2529383 RepID=UPI0012BC36BD|nr:hypothetical protein [Fulvivirga aurantia]MTI22512.1 hypothetical protein [Fulvivirga aurantia]